MGKRSQIDKAIKQLDDEIAVLTAAKVRLEQQVKPAPRVPRKTPTPNV